MESNVIVLVVFLLFVAVGKEALGQTDDYVRAITFNTALFDFSPDPALLENNREQRLQGTIAAVRNSRADLVCLQEVWLAQDVQRIVNEASDVFSYSYSPIHNPDGSLPPQTNVPGDAPCTRQASLNLEQCSRLNNCTNPDIRIEQPCSAEKCPAELFAILQDGQECVTCLSVSSESAELALERCSSPISPTANPRRMNTLGLALLSKRPLSAMEHSKFYPGVVALIDRGYISAKYDGNLNVVCTHLTSLLSEIREPFLSQQFPTYNDQNIYEVSVLTSTFGHVTPLILLGDMNVGEMFNNQMVGVSPNHYKFLKLGFQAHVPLRSCSFCVGDRNPYNAISDEAKSIDHVFGNGINIKRLQVVFGFEEAYVTDVSGTRFPLSDHYGVQATFRYPCRC